MENIQKKVADLCPSQLLETNEVNGFTYKVKSEERFSEKTHEDNAEKETSKNDDTPLNGEIKKKKLKKVTFSNENIFFEEEEEEDETKKKEEHINNFHKMEDILKEEEAGSEQKKNIHWRSQNNGVNGWIRPETETFEQQIHFFRKGRNEYKEKPSKKESDEEFEKIEFNFDTQNNKSDILLNEEEIKKILIEGEINGFEEINYMNDTKETNDVDYKNQKNQKDMYKEAYEKSMENYKSSSFIHILNSFNKNPLCTSSSTNNNNNNNNNNDNNNNNNSNNNMIEPVEMKNKLLQTADQPEIITFENKNYVNKGVNNEMAAEEVCIISCILCGDKIKSNMSKMCNNCLLQNIEVTSFNINKDTYTIFFCRDCRRYLHNRWVYCELESKELLALCLKKVTKLKKLKIQSAKFLYTEPHSKRLKVQLSVQEELINNFISEMDIVLHYVIKYTQCDDCKKKYTPHTYNTCVSVRQKVEHKKTLLFLENLILQNNVNENVINIVSKPDGIDFHFNSRADGLKFCDFILSKTISKCKASKHLITHDVKNNTYNYKYNFAIDICPICKYDLVFIDKELASKYGIKSFLYLCIHAAVYIMLIHPFSPTNNVFISEEKYHKAPFLPILSMAQSKCFLILNVEYIKQEKPKGLLLKGDVANPPKKKKFKKKKKKRAAATNHTDEDSDEHQSKRLRLRRKKRSYGEENFIQKENEDFDDDEEEEEEEQQQQEEEREKETYEKNQMGEMKNVEKLITSQEKKNIEENENDEVSDYDTLIDTNIDTKSCKSTSRKLKLDKLVYAYVELYDESNGGTVMTMTYNAKHLKPGDYVNVYDLRTQTVNDKIHQFLETNDMYRVIIIDKVKAKQKRRILNEISVNSNNVETMRTMNEEELFNEKMLNRLKQIENMHL